MQIVLTALIAGSVTGPETPVSQPMPHDPSLTPPTPASTTESLGDSGNEFSPEKSPAPGAASPCVCLLYNADSPLLTGYRAVYTYFPCATGGQLYTRRDVRIPSSLLDSDSDDAAPTKKQKYN